MSEESGAKTSTLRPAGTGAVPPPAREPRAARSNTLRPAGATAVPPPAPGSSLTGSAPSYESSEQPREAAPPLRKPRRLSPTHPYFTGVSPDLELATEGLSFVGLFRADAPAFDARLSARLFARRAPRSRNRSGSRKRPRAAERRPDRDPELPEVGAIVEKYRLEELLGVGGFAAVYRATHLLLRTPVAIKMLRPRVLRRRSGLARALCEEARFAAKINHPNVVRVFDVTHTPKITYVVMEYIDGDTLARVIQRKGVMPARAVIEVGLDVSAGLAAGLEQGLIHRDIKPANIILTQSMSAKIVDLGLAGSSTPGEPEGDRSTMSRSIVGTHGYMAPEVTACEPVDFRADVYSLGVTLYQAALGRLPFPNDNPELCMRMHREHPVPVPHELRPELPRSFSDLLLWMLAKRPADRPGSYAELERGLRRALGT